MLPRIVSSLLFLAPLMFAADAVSNPALKIIHVSHTDTFTLPAGGALRLQRSFGELSIEGWDRAEVEVTVIKSTKDFFASNDVHATADLARCQVEAALHDKDVIVTTGYPHRSFPPRLPWSEPMVDVEYRIKAPKEAPIFIEHGMGEVHLYNVAGDVHASVRNGGITLDLPPESQYGIEANSDWGGVNSFFQGKPHRRFWVIGHQLKSEGGPHQLVLKTGYGDIIIFKAWKPDSTH